MCFKHLLETFVEGFKTSFFCKKYKKFLPPRPAARAAPEDRPVMARPVAAVPEVVVPPMVRKGKVMPEVPSKKHITEGI